MKYLSFLFLLCFALTGCIKEESEETGTAGGSTTYFLKFKLNGTAKNLNFNNQAKLVNDQNITSLSFIGFAAASTVTSMENINLSIFYLTGSTSTGTFTEGGAPGVYVVSGTYQDNSNSAPYAAGQQGNPTLPLTINLTKLDGKEAEGTFEGAFYKQDASGAQTSEVLITEGSFKLPVK